MSKLNIADAKSVFSELVQKAMVGEEVIIAKDNKPVVKVVFSPPGSIRPPARLPGAPGGLFDRLCRPGFRKYGVKRIS